MSRFPYKTMSRTPYKKLSRTPYKKCLDLLTDKTLDFCYNVVVHTGSITIEAFVAVIVREGGQYERLAADPTLAEVSQWMVGCVDAVLVKMPACRRPEVHPDAKRRRIHLKRSKDALYSSQNPCSFYLALNLSINQRRPLRRIRP
jgi:hypothetical protein